MIVDLALDDIPLDRGTQVRAQIDDAVVADYAERMGEGVIFPPVKVFNDARHGNLLADGFHRIAAARRIGRTHILADVSTGTMDDALLFAFRANRDHGLRYTEADKTNGVRMALARWPEKMQREIADLIGCSHGLVSKVAGDIASANGGVRDIRGRALVLKQKREAVREMVLAGHQSIAIRKALHAHPQVIGAVRKELGVSKADYSRRAAKERLDRIRELALEGHSSRQIAADVGLSGDHCRNLARKAGIDIPADRVIRGTHHLDPNRILAGIAMSADNLTAGANLIDYHALDRSQLADWIRSLTQARAELGALIKRLKQESSHGEAA